MPLNQEFVGRIYPPAEAYAVGREKVREFATAIGEENPIFHSVAAAQQLGYNDVLAPPTFGFVLSNRATDAVLFDPDLGLDYSKVVHGEQRFAYTRPIVAGDVLVTQVSIDSIRSAAGNDLISVRAEISTEGGEHVVTTFSTIVARGTAS
jgi:acyl dehydratase